MAAEKLLLVRLYSARELGAREDSTCSAVRRTVGVFSVDELVDELVGFRPRGATGDLKRYWHAMCGAARRAVVGTVQDLPQASCRARGRHAQTLHAASDRSSVRPF